MPIIYFILTGTCMSQIMQKINGVPEWLTWRQPYILVTAALLGFFILKKELLLSFWVQVQKVGSFVCLVSL